MTDVIDFPGKPLAPAESDRAIRERREFQLDCGYAAEALKEHLPAEVQRNIAGLHLDSIAAHVVLAIDAARHGRLLDPDYDDHRRGGVIGALSRMIQGTEPVDAPEPPDPPDCA